MANIFYDYVLDELRLKDVPDGSGGFWGSFYDTTTQNAASTTVAYPITLNTTSGSNGVAIGSPTSRVVFTYAGVYSITFSIQFENSDSDDVRITTWLKKNGTDITDSSSITSVPKFHRGDNGAIITTINYVIELQAGDYIETYWQTESTDVSVTTIPAGTTPTTPLSPSIILTAVQGGIITQGSTTNSLASLTDVSFTSLASGQIIMSNASGNWGNVNFPAIPSIPSLGSLAVLNTLDYSALTGKPSLGSLAVLNDLSFTSLLNQPSLSSLAFQSTIDYTSAQLLNKPSLGSLAILNDLSYTSLLNLPSLGSLAVLNDLSYTSLLNLPSLGSLAVLDSLSFTSLTNQPSLSSLAFQSTVDYVTQVTGKPSLGSLAVLDSLSFTSLTNQPSLSSLAFQSTIDYNSAQLLNKPSLGSLAEMNALSFTSLLNQPSLGSIAFQNTVDYSQLTNTPSLGSLAVMNQLSFTSLLNQPSLSSLAFQSTIDYTSAQLTNKPSLGSLAQISDVVVPLVLSGATLSLSEASIVHNNLGGLTTGDPHTQYALLAGRSGSQELFGGTAVNGYLWFKATSASGNTPTNAAILFGVGDGGGDTMLQLNHDGSLEQAVYTTTNVAGYSLDQTITGTSGDNFGAVYTITDSGGGVKTDFGFRSALNYTGTGSLAGMQSTSNQLNVTGGGTVNFAEVLTSNLTVDNNSTVDEATLIKLFGVTKGVGSTINTLTGLYLPNLTEGTTNWSIYSDGGTMFHEGTIIQGNGYLSVNDSNLTPIATGATGDILAGNGNANFQYDASTGFLNLEKSISNAQGIDFSFYKSRGATASPIIVTAGDDIGLIRAYAYQASSYAEVTRITFETLAGGATNSGVIRFYTANAGTMGERVVIREDGDVGIGIATPTAKLHVDQTSTTAATPVLTLDQADLTEEFINFAATVGATNPIQTATTLPAAPSHRVRVAVNGTLRFIYLYAT